MEGYRMKKCPVCVKEYKGLATHMHKKTDKMHKDYIVDFYTIVDPLLHTLYIKDIQKHLKNEHPKYTVYASSSILKGRRTNLGINGCKIHSIQRTGENNPAKKQEVRDKIKATVKEHWKNGRYKNRINGMTGKVKELHHRWKEEVHTSTHLAQINYRELLSAYQDISVCARCEKNESKPNVHHIDEDHKNFLISNLEPLCVGCHSSYHYKYQKLPFITIGKTFSFAAAHFLPEHMGLCKEPHGHEWKLEVQLRKRIDKKTGMVVDFSILKKAVKECVVDILDHNFLNLELPNPTAENLLIWIWEKLMFDHLLKGIESITLWESEGSKAILDKEGMLSIFKNNIENYVPNLFEEK
jgi:6-pyruvoyltetrahydropterin/6-carboxytetrahydropterin synthase